MTTLTEEQQQSLLAQFSADALQGLDAVCSPQTLELVELHGADGGVDMTYGWSITPQNWSCPSCHRHKRELVRLNAHRELMCRIVEHHDHIVEYITRRFMDLATRGDEVHADWVGAEFARRLAPVVCLHDAVLICGDCNTADAQAKKKLSLPTMFSFPASAIGEFFHPAPNTPPGAIHYAWGAARAAWDQHRPLLKQRLALIEHVCELAARNAHWLEIPPESAHPQKRSDAAALSLHRRCPGVPITALSANPRHAKNVRAATSNWRAKPRSAVRIPTANDIQLMLRSRPPARGAHPYDQAGENWHCPCCGRARFECVRSSNQGLWTFELKQMSTASGCVRNLNLPRTLVCGDCANTARQLGREVRTAHEQQESDWPFVPSYLASIDEIRALITARPHQSHVIDPPAADRLVARLTRETLAATRLA